ncbi:MAG: SUMF1/EgtB/PvdO family nonheme iron enzyme [Nitrospira sp.]|nr:SUMF1/EgtB/PvdO family nonheme iron enzyme [Nitrospira sp.]
MSDIFISYSSEDKNRVQALARALERKGWSVWWDRHIPIGRSFDEVIEEALDASKAVVVVWTQTSVKSQWVKNEAREGLRRGVLFPVMLLEEVKIPLEFRDVQTAQLMEWQPEQEHAGFNQFVEDIALRIGVPCKDEPQQPDLPAEVELSSEGREIQSVEQPGDRANDSHSSIQSPPYVLLGGSLLVIVGMFAVYWITSLSSHPPKRETPLVEPMAQQSLAQSQVTTPPPAAVPSEKPVAAPSPKKPAVVSETKIVSRSETKPRPKPEPAKKNAGNDGTSKRAPSEQNVETKLANKPTALLDSPKVSAHGSEPSQSTQQQSVPQATQQLQVQHEPSVQASAAQPVENHPPKITGKDGAPMVLVPAGEFMMGDNFRDEDERPVHLVYLDSFYIDQHEVTTTRYTKFLQTAYRAVPKHWSDQVQKQQENRPVVGVAWNDATAYCFWAGKRLPTEAEWEKAARGTDQRVYPWGKEAPNGQRANFDLKDYGSLTDVGSFEGGKSPYGLYDMAGNVSEWVWDWYDERYYIEGITRNPKGYSSGKFRVIRGGSWRSGWVDIRSTGRSAATPTDRYGDVGFRCAQDVPK